MSYALPDEGSRYRRLHWLYRRMLRLWVGKVVLVADGERRGLAVQYPPDADPRYSLRRQIAIGLLAAPLRVGLGATRRLQKVASWVDRMHAQVRNTGIWYLDFVAVIPEARGRGIGTSLLVDRLRLVEQSGLPCYVTTAQPAIASRYQRHGFVIVQHGPMGSGGPHGWLLYRAGHHDRKEEARVLSGGCEKVKHKFIF